MVRNSIATTNDLIEVGDKYYDENSFNLALINFEKVLVLDPSNVNLLYKIGICHLNNFEIRRAITYFTNNLIVEISNEKTNQNLGFAFNLSGETERAMHYFHIAYCINPANFASHYNLGIACFSLNQHDQSQKHLLRASLINPLSHETFYNLGVINSHAGKHEQAAFRYLQSITISPGQSASLFNLGVSYFELSNPRKAIDSYQSALMIDADHIQSHWNLSHCLLLVDDYRNGFLEYEWRWKQNEATYQQKQRSFLSQLWLGQTSLDQKTILIYAEQGFGDTLQFIRFCNHSAFARASLIVEVQEDLVGLIQSSFPNLKVIAQGLNVVESDFHVPLMSLPLALGLKNPLSLDSQIYLKPRNISVDKWKVKTSNFSKPRIGLVWSSGYRKDQEDTWDANKRRNLQLLSFHFLKDFDVTYFTLQKGFIPQSELTALKNEKWGGPHLIDFTDELTDFEETAALISQLDLIITVDTSVAHLAGGMGKQTLLLLKFNADWRWHHLSNQSKWYPNTRIFRQSKPNDWNLPLEELRKYLAQFFVTTDYS
jgi:tetratricopeptide (TPR) repeat protein